MADQIAITAKIICNRKDPQDAADDQQVILEFGPDYADGRNKEWAQFTPGLSLTMGVKPEVARHFDQGGHWTLTFTPNQD